MLWKSLTENHITGACPMQICVVCNSIFNSLIFFQGIYRDKNNKSCCEQTILEDTGVRQPLCPWWGTRFHLDCSDTNSKKWDLIFRRPRSLRAHDLEDLSLFSSHNHCCPLSPASSMVPLLLRLHYHLFSSFSLIAQYRSSIWNCIPWSIYSL